MPSCRTTQLSDPLKPSFSIVANVHTLAKQSKFPEQVFTSVHVKQEFTHTTYVVYVNKDLKVDDLAPLDTDHLVSTIQDRFSIWLNCFGAKPAIVLVEGNSPKLEIFPDHFQKGKGKGKGKPPGGA